jgi:SAM-dependent methyltransferase
MSRSEIILRHIVRNGKLGLRHALARRDDYSGSLPSFTPEEAAAYARTVFDRYVKGGGLGEESIRGARVLEIGPGDSLGVSLLFARAGAERVTALDKFRYSYDTPRHRKIEQALETGRAEFDRVHALAGWGIEHAGSLFPPESFDLIVSNAVLEECADPDRAMAAMAGLLRRGGRMLHQVDVSDYGIFSRHGFSPLEFLTVAEPVYRAMTVSSGGPNRRLLDYYRRQMEALHCEAKFTTTNRYPPESAAADAIRPRLLREYRPLAEEDLLVSGFFVSARKA